MNRGHKVKSDLQVEPQELFESAFRTICGSRLVFEEEAHELDQIFSSVREVEERPERGCHQLIFHLFLKRLSRSVATAVSAVSMIRVPKLQDPNMCNYSPINKATISKQGPKGILTEPSYATPLGELNSEQGGTYKPPPIVGGLGFYGAQSLTDAKYVWSYHPL
ncbi:hypothetical protein TNCV_452681 [Trichonephila clavipes]|nr:hypothetical protein TNCV_452681 [Trichonephila clavipes]